MADGTRGGSNDAALPLIATDDLTSGTFSGMEGQVVKLGVGANGAMEQVDAGNPLPVVQTGTPGLPTGAATAANQTTLIGHVDTLETLLVAIQAAVEMLDNIVSGSEAQVDVLTLPALVAGTANIGDVDVLTVPADPFGANADAAVAAGATGSIQAKLRRLSSDIDAVKTAVEIIDNAISGSEMQVDVLTSALPTGAATESTLDARTGALTETAPGTDTASSGINGRLQRIAQRFTSLIALLPTSIGQKNTAGSLSVTLSSDHGAVTVTGGGGDGAVLDGVSAAIKATVLDYTNSNPLAVRLTDTTGDYVGAGAGTQYTEDAAAAADPTGSALMMVRDDVLSGQVTADGDNVAARGTDKGELYVKHVDAIPVTDNGGALTVDGTVAATQSGTWTVQPGNTANTTAWKVDGSAVTQPVSGAVTSGHDVTGIGDGRKVVTTAGTRVTLAASTPAKSVVITAETDNTGIVVVGAAATVIAALATRVGTPLSAGDSMSLLVDNLTDVGLDATVDGDGVTFTYLT